MIFYEDRKKIIGERIKAEREKKGLSKPDLLKKICMSENSHKSVTAWEKGEILPSLDNLSQMAELFNCDIGYLLGDYDERTRDLADVCQVTGLSGESAATLQLLNSRGNRPGERGAYIDGIQIEELSLLDDVITSNRFHSLFNAVSAYLIYGMANTKVPLPNMPQEEYENMRKWLLDRGLVISSKRNICDMYLQNAADELKAIFKEVLESKKEDAQNG